MVRDITITVGGSDVTNDIWLWDLKAVLNSIPLFSFQTRADFHKNDAVRVTDGARTIFNGYIDTEPTKDYNSGIITCACKGNIAKLEDARSESRREWNNSDTQTILTAVLSPYYSTLNISNYGPLSVVDEYSSPLHIVSRVAMASKGETSFGGQVISTYDFWEDENTGAFHFAPYRGAVLVTPTPPLIINQDVWDFEENAASVNPVNSIIVTGKGDGINQIVRRATNFKGTIETNIGTGAGSLEFSEDDYNSLKEVAMITHKVTLPSGDGVKVKIGNEILGIVDVDNNDGTFTYSVRAANRGLDGTTAAAHSIGNLATGGSILEQGLYQKTFYDRATVDSDTAYKMAQAAVTELSGISGDAMCSSAELFGYWLGDKVELRESGGALVAEYRILGVISSQAQGYYQLMLGSISRGQMEMYQQIIGNLSDGATYAQGATNIYSVQDSDNCDTSFPLTVKFYIPPEAVRINHVKVNFTIENYRAYSTGAASGGGTSTTTQSEDHSHAGITTDLAGGSNLQADFIDSGGVAGVSEAWLTYETINMGAADTQGMHLMTFMARSEPTDFVFMRFRVKRGATYFPNETGIWVPMWTANLPGANTQEAVAGTHIFVPENTSSQSYEVQCYGVLGLVSESDWGHETSAYTVARHQHDLSISSSGSHSHNISLPNHTHGINYGIFEDSLTNPSVEVAVNGNSFGAFTTGQNNLDASSVVTGEGWYNLTFTPNQRMRINASVFIQIYIKSE